MISELNEKERHLAETEHWVDVHYLDAEKIILVTGVCLFYLNKIIGLFLLRLRNIKKPLVFVMSAAK